MNNFAVSSLVFDVGGRRDVLFVMEGDTFILTTDKKLRANWSSHIFGAAIHGSDIDKLRNNFESFDKKTKV
jgi:hypothetical protein